MSPDFDILVIDDEPVVLAAARKILEPEGFSVDEAERADVAMEKLEKSTYRAVLCDLKLPKGKSWELVGFAREHLPHTPVVMITGYATLDNALRSFRSGAFDFLPKPFDVGELLGVVNRALNYAATGRILALSGRYALGLNSWARLERNGTARIGIGESFARLDGEVHAIDLPAVDEETLQGRMCARIVTSNERVHSVWAPLSGRVIEWNPALAPGNRQNLELTAQTWLLRILPTDLEDELPNLTPH